jgi:hypothetical protein
MAASRSPRFAAAPDTLTLPGVQDLGGENRLASSSRECNERQRGVLRAARPRVLLA